MPIIYSGGENIKDIMNCSNAIAGSQPPLHINQLGTLIHGENFLALCRLLNNYSKQVDLIYIDPPYNTKAEFYYSEKRSSHVSPSMSSEIAYSDKLGFDEYLDFIRNRLLVSSLLLSDCGSIYVHVDVKIGHYIKMILDDVFGRHNFINEITRVKSNPKNFSRNAYGNQKDLIFFYSKLPKQNIFNNIKELSTPEEILRKFPKIDPFGRRYTTVPCHAPGETRNGQTGQKWRGMNPPQGRHWRCAPEKLEGMDKEGLIEWSENNVPRIKKYADEHDGKKIQDVWLNYKDPPYPVYPTEKNIAMLEMIVRQSSMPDSIIMDFFCGSGAFLAAGMRHGRRVIGIDESEIAIQVASARPELAGLPVVRLA